MNGTSLEEIKKIQKTLKDNPVFSMSLSGKELFHSNMIAWLLEDKDIRLRFCLPKGHEDYVVYGVLREFKKLDLLILYNTAKNVEKLKELQEEITADGKTEFSEDERELLDAMRYVVVENKFKSLPDAKQLAGYTEKINKGMVICKREKKSVKIDPATVTKYILAPDCAFVSEIPEGWEKQTYTTLVDEVERKLEEMENGDECLRGIRFILEYYKSMLTEALKIADMARLATETLDKPAVLDNGTIGEFRKIRMHDFYEKLWIAMAERRLAISHEGSLGREVFFRPGYIRAMGYFDWKLPYEKGANVLYLGVEVQRDCFRISVEPKYEYKYTQTGKPAADAREAAIKEWLKTQILDRVGDEVGLKPKAKKGEAKGEVKLNKFGDFRCYNYELPENLTLKDLKSTVERVLDIIDASDKGELDKPCFACEKSK